MVRGQNGEIVSAFRSRNRSDQKGKARVLARHVGVAAFLGAEMNAGLTTLVAADRGYAIPPDLGLLWSSIYQNK
jgi:hypothetical protein